MPADTEYLTFSIRLPEDLVQQLGQRARISKRSRNAEIHHLLCTAIDAEVKKDLDEMQRIHALNHPDDSPKP